MLLEKATKNFGKIKMDLYDYNLNYRDIRLEGPEYINDEKQSISEANTLVVTAVIDLYNSKERFTTIKDLNLILKHNKRDYVFEDPEITVNGIPMQKYRNKELLNIISLKPKEVQRIAVKGNIKIDKFENGLNEADILKIYLLYNNEKSKRKTKFLFKSKLV